MSKVNVLGGLILLAAACGGTDAPAADLAQRAYLVSRDSPDLTVIDLRSLEVVAKVNTGGLTNHMAEISAGLDKVFVTSPETNEVIVVDTRTFAVITRINVGAHPTHASMARDGKLLAIMTEWDDAISFIDPVANKEVKRLDGFHTPHFMRFAADGRYGYVANAHGNSITRVDLQTLTIDGQILPQGVAADAPLTEEGGFKDAQIDAEGILYAAHADSGRVLVYDTVAGTQKADLVVGAQPWSVFAEHPFTNLPRRYLVPNFGDQTIPRIDGQAGAVEGSLPGDEEAYGVNYSSLTPGKAFVMNRVREDIAVVDLMNGSITSRIPVGGNTETAATTADGKYIVAAVSGADRVVVIDAVTNAIVKTFDGMPAYPWSVTIPYGQNYCH